MMNALDRNLDGCCIRGLPIGRPFRTRFEVPNDYETGFTDTTDVFILLRYKDMQGGLVIDLSEPEKQDIPSERKENTLKRRILNRQNITKEKSCDKQESDSEEEPNSDVESVTIENLLELHVDTESGTSYYSNPVTSHTGGTLLKSDMGTASFYHTGQAVTEEELEQQNEVDEETLSGTDKIVYALLNRQLNDRNTTNDEEEVDAVIPGTCTGSLDSKNENKTAEEKSDLNLLQYRKRKIKEEATEVKRAKLKKIEENEAYGNRRVSHRLRSAGYRPDYVAMEKFTNTNGVCNGVDDDGDDTDSYDVDKNREHKKQGGSMKVAEGNKIKKVYGKKKSESMAIVPDENPDQKKVDALKVSITSQRNTRLQKVKKKNKKKIFEGKKQPKASVQETTSNSEFENKVADGKLQTVKMAVEEIDDSIIENEKDPNDPDFEVQEGKRDKNKKSIKHDLENEQDGDETNGKTKGRVRNKQAKIENDFSDKPKCQRKSKELKANNAKTEKTDDDDDDDDDGSSLVESDPELSGLARYKRNILIAKRRKLLEQREKRATRIKVKLHEHTDKWRKDVMDSFMRKDRGKARYEVAVEMYVCTVCDKYKAESKESMENHIEMHVNGDLQCNHPHCTYIAVTNFELQKHKRDVHKKNIWICDICGLETIGREGLRDHLGKVHDSPQWSCKLCLKEDKKFASVTLHEYKKHLRSAHPESMFRCDGCKRLFAQQHKLDNHLKIGCEGEGRKSYSCEKCGKVFSSHDSVKRHIMRVHNKERSFQCPHCPFTAARQTNLTSHLNVHEGYHPFKCDQCTFSCVQKYQLKSHMRTHSGEKPYKCKQCNYAAAWNVQLKDHVKAHSLPNAVYCELCNILFKDIRALKTHETKEHGLSSTGGPQKAIKTSPEPQQIIVNNVNSTYAVPQTYAPVINYSTPYIPAQHPLPYLAHYAAPYE